MNNQIEEETNSNVTDSFLDNSILSRINRRFSKILHGLFPVPGSWSEAPTDCFRALLARLNSLSLLLLLLAGIAMSISMITIAVREDSLSTFFYGLAIVPGVFLIQFIAGLFCSANLNLTFGRTITLSSRNVPETLIVMGIGWLLYAIAVWVLTFGEVFQFSTFMGILVGLWAVISILAIFYLPWLAANSDLLKVDIKESANQGAAEYLICIVQFLGRYIIAWAPVQFAFSMFLVAMFAVYTLFFTFKNGDTVGEMVSNLGSWLPSGLGLETFSQMTVFGILVFFVLSALIPVLAHFVGLFILGIADLGASFFRLVNSSSKVADLSEIAMSEAANAPEKKEHDTGSP